MKQKYAGSGAFRRASGKGIVILSDVYLSPHDSHMVTGPACQKANACKRALPSKPRRWSQ